MNKVVFLLSGRRHRTWVQISHPPEQLSLPILLLLFLISGTVSAEGVYKWVDESGKVHFSDTPQHQSSKKLELSPVQTYQQERRKGYDHVDVIEGKARLLHKQNRRLKAKTYRQSIKKKKNQNRNTPVQSDARQWKRIHCSAEPHSVSTNERKKLKTQLTCDAPIPPAYRKIILK